MTESELEQIYESRFYLEWDLKFVNVEGKCMSLSYYILTTTIDHLDAYLKRGERPFREWRIAPIKAYFNIYGRTPYLLERLTELKQQIDDNNVYYR